MKNNTIKKIDLVNYLSEITGIGISESSEIIDLFFNILIDGIVQSSELKITGLGNFSIKDKKERIGRNPKTKEVFKITSRKVISFKPAEILKKI